MAEPGDSPVMNGTGGPANDIQLLSGVSHVTIRGLEIKNYSSRAVKATVGPTSHITVHYNYLHDNVFAGVDAFSNGSFIHSNWAIEHNFITDNPHLGINLINTTKSVIKDNFLRGNGTAAGPPTVGIFIGAFNTTGAGAVTVTDVVVEGNEVSSSGTHGIILRASTDSTGGTARLTSSKAQYNNSHDNGNDGISLVARGMGATSDLNRVEYNLVVGNIDTGIRLGALFSGINTRNLVRNNTVGAHTNQGIRLEAEVSGIVSRIKVEKNTLFSNLRGIDLIGDDATVTKNKLENNNVDGNIPDGISLIRLGSGIVEDNEIDDNSATGNGGNGFNAGTGTEDNLFVKNHANVNGGFGYFDTGISNTFEDNQCNFNGSGGSAPAGLCSP